MKKLVFACGVAVSVSAFAADGKAAMAPAPSTTAAPAPAATAAPAPAGATAPAGMNMADMMTKMGPAARKPTDEKKTKKEVEEFFKKGEMAESKGDWEAMVAMHDFPVYMATDDLKGMPNAKPYSKEEFIAMMKPMMDNMPKDSKTTHKQTLTVLSDSLVNVVDEFTMTMGKNKVNGRNAGLLVKVDGNWKWKAMVEAGWGEEPKTAAAPSPATAAPAATNTATAAPAANTAKTPASAPVAPPAAKK